MTFSFQPAYKVVLLLFFLCSSRVLVGTDCNANGVEDATDIAVGDVEDCNLNGLPDVCEGPPFQFSEFADLAFDSKARAVVPADFNGDGLRDLAIGLLGEVEVRFSEVAGDFENFSRVSSPVATTNPTAWAGGDFDGDGDVDLAALENSLVVIAYNAGDGAFEDGPTMDVGGRLAGLAVADLRGDGSADVIVTDVRNDLVQVILTVDGNFQAPVGSATGDDPRAVGVGDIDGDGVPDVVVLNRAAASLSLFLNDGSGGLSTWVTLDGVGRGAQKLVVADLTDDELADLVTGDVAGVSVRLNQGEGAFAPPVPLVADRVNTASIGSGDVDGDGDVDIVASYAQPPGVHLFVNGGTGAFNAGLPLARQSIFSQIVVHDTDADGVNDLLLTRGGSNTVTVGWNSQTQSGVPFVTLRTFASRKPHDADTGDLDGDGDLDLALVHSTVHGLTVMLNDGDGGFTDQDTGAGGGAQHVVTVDLDNDGDLDIVTDATWSVFSSYTNDGEAGFELRESIGFPSSVGQVVVGDLDRSGSPDVVTCLQALDRIVVLFNDGMGFFPREDIDEYVAGTNPVSQAVVDIDNDGDLDIAVANSGSSNVSIFENDGEGFFTLTVNFPVTGGPVHIEAADLDLDGHVDLVTANLSQGEASFLWNVGRNSLEFEPAERRRLDISPRSLLTVDLNDDGRPEVVAVEETPPNSPGSISILVNDGRREFSPPDVLLTGSGPRYLTFGDVDGDADIDIVSANRGSEDVTVFFNGLSMSSEPDYLESVCTPAEYFELSVQSRATSSTRRSGKYLLAARDDPNLHTALFQNVNRFRLHEDFLAEAFPTEFGFLLDNPERYDELIGRRATRDYYAGVLDLRARDDGVLYTFNIVKDTGFDPREELTQEEVSDVYHRLQIHFLLGPLAYAPDSQSSRDAAATWLDPDFPIFVDNTPPPFQYEAYTLGLGYGRLRILTLEEFEAANREGRFTFQDGVVIEEVSPPDIEGVVGFVFTGGVQGELAHLPIRTARRGTPNAFASNVREKFAQYEGELVRVEVFPENFFVSPVDSSEAEGFWAQIRRELPEPPFIDASHTQFDSFLTMDLNGRPQGRYGGKATNLGRLQRVILRDGTLDGFLESGFSIPTHYYREFMQTNFRGAQTYEEYIQEIVAREDVRTDSNLRFELLDEFRDFVRAGSAVDADLVQSLALKIESEFGDLATMVRFRSSSNAEDALVFNGAGLYESTSVCALDTLDGNERNFSHCDPKRGSERTIERALKKVWSSLWTFRAHEERSFYQIDPHDAVMGIAVTRAFLNEDANGVAFTGSPRDVDDKNYVITAQAGEGSVVSPPAGTTVERTLLEVGDGGEVENIIRSRASNQVPPGETVVREEHLRELARFMWRIETAWEFDLPDDVSREHVILDFEFKVEPDGSLAVKQVRPFLIPTPDLRTPTFELEIPMGTLLCGVFSPDRFGRTPQEEYEFKSQVRLHGGVFELPTDGEGLTANLISEVRFGPDQKLATPIGDGRFEFRTVPDEGSQTDYIFSYTQEFTLPGGELFEVRIDSLRFLARGSIALERRVVLDDHYNTFTLVMQAALAGEPRVAYSSCTYRELPRWQLDVELQGGDRLSLIERFLAEDSLIKTGRASLAAAEVEIEGARQTVEDYWRLVYTARRHNVNVEYWVFLDPELNAPSLQRPVHVVAISGLDGLEEMRYQCPTVMVRYLDADFNVIATPSLTSCVKETTVDPGPRFLRGEVDGDGNLTVGDAIVFLRYFFAGGTAPTCLSSADANDDGGLNVADAIPVLLHLFGGRSTLPPPFFACGTDPTPDDLSCVEFDVCATE